MLKTLTTAVLAVSFAGSAMAQDPQNANFQAFSSDGQKGYIGASIAMAQTLLSKTQADCIGSWAKANEPNGYKEVVAAIKKYADYHPSGVIAAIIEKQCGKFELTKN